MTDMPREHQSWSTSYKEHLFNKTIQCWEIGEDTDKTVYIFNSKQNEDVMQYTPMFIPNQCTELSNSHVHYSEQR